jgi:hypothetical protein
LRVRVNEMSLCPDAKTRPRRGPTRLGGLACMTFALLCVCLLIVTQRSGSAQKQTGSANNTWWAFGSPRKPAVPTVAGVSNPIDAFLLTKLREKGLGFAPPADRRILIRRASFDLTGLPPKPELLSKPYAQALEDLLVSPHYGERWGRHWLDVVRFGETDGGEHNYERFNAWPYRDYVIDAFNKDLPYNQFIREQIAGDILFPNDRSKIAATGFLVSGPWDQVSAELNKDPTMRKMARMDELDDMVTTTSATFLGLTVNCARCHDHKFDPIPARDYYRMTAAFSGAGFGERSVASAAEREQYDAQVKPIRSEMDKVRGQLAEIEGPITARLILDKYIAFDRSRRDERRRIPLNPFFNRNNFTPVTARYVRLAISGQVGSKASIDQLEVLPVGHVVRDWRATETAGADKPVYLTVDLGQPQQVGGIVWSCNPQTGDRDGTVTLYRLEASEDGKQWRTIASSLDHVSSLELELPVLTEEEIEAALAPDARDRRKTLQTQRDQLQTRLNAIPTPARIYTATTRKPEKAYLLERGSVLKQVEEVTSGALSAVAQLPAVLKLPPDAEDGQRRLALAEWIADPKNPLTARVIVNRVWYYHFGSGIVNTPSDFGLNGDRPSHPELLDWLAVSFMEHGWSLKWLHRQIMTSRAYQQSSAFNAKAHKIDAGNRLLWRMPLKRMDAESLRDAILWVSGNLDFKMGGPSFALQQKGARGSYIYKTVDNDGPEVWRRAVYRFVVRGGERIFMDSFDCPDPSVATPQRTVSNTPVQALTLMNNAFLIRQAGLFAKRLEKEAATQEGQVRRAYRLAFGREARAKEIATGLRFLKSRSLALYCRALLNSNEFVYIP